MKKSFFKISAFVAVSLISSIALTACEDGADGAQGVAGAQGEQGEPGTSCTAKKLKDGSGYELKCDGETVGTILNGEEGKQGEPGEKGDPGANGTNCTVADTMDAVKGRAGYKLICADTLKGVVWDGVNGEAGASALELSGYDDMDELLDALKGDPGKSGTSCTVADTTDRGDSTRTGYKLLCGSTLKGVVWNGEKGQKGDPADLTLEYYNKLLLGQKGEGFSWDAKDGKFYTSVADEEIVWWIWTDVEYGGTSGFDLAVPFGVPDLTGSQGWSDALVEQQGGVGGKFVINGIYTRNDGGGISGGVVQTSMVLTDENKTFPVSKMLGLCIEFINDYNNLSVEINYWGEELNDYGRPFFKLPVTTKKKVLNLPWAIFDKTNHWANVQIDVADAIKVMKGVTIHAVNETDENITGEFLITKLGAYGTCE